MALSEAFLVWEQETKNQSRDEGRQEGRQEGERSLILLLLSRKVGSLPRFLTDRIAPLKLEQLEALAIAILSFNTLTDVEQWLDENG